MKKVLTANPADGIVLGNSTSDKISFYGVAPVAQRSGAVQAAVTTTAATTTTPFGFSTSTQANGVVTLLNEIRATLVQNGMMAGA